MFDGRHTECSWPSRSSLEDIDVAPSHHSVGLGMYHTMTVFRPKVVKSHDRLSLRCDRNPCRRKPRGSLRSREGASQLCGTDSHLFKSSTLVKMVDKMSEVTRGTPVGLQLDEG
jgi:hypothetical protein